MSSDPVAVVVRLLIEAGYSSLPVPATIGPMQHDFDAVLAGRDRSLDIVVVADTLRDDSEVLRRKVRTLGRALDLVGSKRPLSVVLVGPVPDQPTRAELGRTARVLAVGTKADVKDDLELRDALAILLPLTVPRVGTELADPLGVLRQTAGAAYGGEFQTALVETSASGASQVESVFRDALTAELLPLEEPESQ